MDKLQIAIRDWYARFQHDKKQYIANILNSAFNAKNGSKNDKQCDDSGIGSSSSEVNCGGESVSERTGSQEGPQGVNPFWGERVPDFRVLRDMLDALNISEVGKGREEVIREKGEEIVTEEQAENREKEEKREEDSISEENSLCSLSLITVMSELIRLNSTINTLLSRMTHVENENIYLHDKLRALSNITIET